MKNRWIKRLEENVGILETEKKKKKRDRKKRKVEWVFFYPGHRYKERILRNFNIWERNLVQMEQSQSSALLYKCSVLLGNWYIHC